MSWRAWKSESSSLTVRTAEGNARNVDCTLVFVCDLCPLMFAPRLLRGAGRRGRGRAGGRPRRPAPGGGERAAAAHPGDRLTASGGRLSSGEAGPTNQRAPLVLLWKRDATRVLLLGGWRVWGGLPSTLGVALGSPDCEFVCHAFVSFHTCPSLPSPDPSHHHNHLSFTCAG